MSQEMLRLSLYFILFYFLFFYLIFIIYFYSKLIFLFENKKLFCFRMLSLQTCLVFYRLKQLTFT